MTIPIRLEAETMTLDGYRLESHSLASSGRVLSLIKGASNERGAAYQSFSGASGRYEVYVSYFDENDGQAQLQLKLGDSFSTSWVLNQNLGNGGISNASRVRRYVGTVDLTTGSRVEIIGQEDAGESARVDYIEFVPTTQTSTPTPTPAPNPTPAPTPSPVPVPPPINAGVLSFSAPTFSVNESGVAIAAVTITRTGGSDGAVTATAIPTNGTATAPGDFSNTAIGVSFGAGDTAPKTISIPIVNDSLVEGNETLNLSLSNPTGGATLGSQSAAVLSIVDNDQATSVDPRLFLNRTRINEIKTAIAIPNSHHQLAFNAIKARVDPNDWRVYDENASDSNWNYARSWLAREASLMYLLTDDSRYAQIAYDNLFAIANNPDPDNRTLTGNSGLSRAMIGMGFAIAYDWAATGWTASQRDWVRSQLTRGLDAWTSFSHANVASPWGSNWVAVTRGAELVMMLAARQETTRASRFTTIKNNLRDHIRTAYGTTGVTQEGNGYLAYGGGFLVPAVYALRDIGDTSLDADFNSKEFWKLATYASTYSATQSSLQFGVGGVQFDNEGWTSLLLNSVPSHQLPYYRFAYDYHRGIQNQAAPAQKFDPRRAGTTWSLIYYPTTGVALDPDPAFAPTLVDDDKGAYFFRNRWQDSDDTLVSFMGDFEWHTKGWDQTEAFNLGLIANGDRFIAGPYKETSAQYFSTLLVDGKNEGSSSGNTGSREFFEASDRGGYAIVNGGRTYSGLGITSAKRHLLVDFADDGSSILSTLDRIQDESSHTYTWQINVGESLTNGGISISRGNEGGLPTFLLRSADGDYVKGWVLHPSNATVTAADPLQILTTGANADIWVTMLVGRGTPQTGLVAGRGMASVLTVNNNQIRYDAATNRIQTEAIAPISGTTSNDTLTGTAGVNLIEGSAGSDTLTGMGSHDIFLYRSATHGSDIITDFNSGDRFYILATGFGGGLEAGVALSTSAAATGSFVSSANPVALGTAANFLYNTSTGILSFDRDGTGTSGAVAIARLQGAPTLTTNQISIVA